jgi:hypothetical protein
MRLSRVPAVIMAVIIGGAGLAACSSGGSSTPNAAGASSGGSSGSPTASASGSGSPTAPASTTATAAPTSSSQLNAVPKNTASTGGGTSFTVPSIPGDNIVSAYGSYTKIGSDRVKVTICAQQTGSAYAVGAFAWAYTATGAKKNVGATVLLGPGHSSCGTQYFLFYTAHLKVYDFIGQGGTITKTGPVLTIY